MAVMRTTTRRFAAAIAATAAAVALGAGSAPPVQAVPGAPGARAVPGARAEGHIIGAGSPDAVKDSYIVMLTSGSGLKAASSTGRNLVKEYGGEVTRTYRSALNGYAAHMSEPEAERLAGDPAVAQVVQDTMVRASGTQPSPPSWGLDRIDQANLPLNSSYTYPDAGGSGVTAYIIDTGVRISHQDFGGRASYGYDAVSDDAIAQDGNGHGTHVAAGVAGSSHGVAKKADIVAVRVLDDVGSGTVTQVVAGVDWVTANAQKPAVANMSLGGGANTAMDAAVRNSIASGITYSVAAGNSSADAADSSPARVTEAITVGATTSADARRSSSNYGAVLDLFAPGSSITSAWNTSDIATATISGSSMASSHACGAAAVYLAGHPGAGPGAVATALVSGATPGVLSGIGSGSPNRLLRVVP
jgi:subtilisin family serine protease